MVCVGDKTLPSGQYVTIYLPGDRRTLNFCEMTVKTKVNGLECSTNVDNTYYVNGNTYQLMCPACATTGTFYFINHDQSVLFS